MADLENQQTARQTVELVFSNNDTVKAQVSSAMHDSLALELLEAKLMARPKKSMPHTYRRPSYLQYIEYV